MCKIAIKQLRVVDKLLLFSFKLIEVLIKLPLFLHKTRIMERKSTEKVRKKIFETIDSVLKEFNSDKGKIEVNGLSIKIVNSLRKSDLYSIISEASGLGLSEMTIYRYYKDYQKSHGDSKNHT